MTKFCEPKLCTSCGTILLLGSAGWVCPNCPARIVMRLPEESSICPDILHEDQCEFSCPKCEGTGNIECDECDGTGEHECWECGQITSCDECEDGYNDCEACDGTGKVIYKTKCAK